MTKQLNTDEFVVVTTTGETVTLSNETIEEIIFLRATGLVFPLTTAELVKYTSEHVGCHFEESSSRKVALLVTFLQAQYNESDIGRQALEAAFSELGITGEVLNDRLSVLAKRMLNVTTADEEDEEFAERFMKAFVKQFMTAPAS